MEVLEFVRENPMYLFFFITQLVIVVLVIRHAAKSKDDDENDDDDGGIIITDPDLDLPPGVSLPTSGPKEVSTF